jgi:hypothetical protein
MRKQLIQELEKKESDDLFDLVVLEPSLELFTVLHLRLIQHLHHTDSEDASQFFLRLSFMSPSSAHEDWAGNFVILKKVASFMRPKDSDLEKIPVRKTVESLKKDDELIGLLNAIDSSGKLRVDSLVLYESDFVDLDLTIKKGLDSFLIKKVVSSIGNTSYYVLTYKGKRLIYE